MQGIVFYCFGKIFYKQTDGFGKLHWHFSHSHSCGQNRTMRVYHYSVNTGHGWTTFPKVALRSLRGSLAFFWKGHGAQSPWLAVSQTYLSALFSFQRTVVKTDKGFHVIKAEGRAGKRVLQQIMPCLYLLLDWFVYLKFTNHLQESFSDTSLEFHIHNNADISIFVVEWTQTAFRYVRFVKL